MGKRLSLKQPAATDPASPASPASPDGRRVSSAGSGESSPIQMAASPDPIRSDSKPEVSEATKPVVEGLGTQGSFVAPAVTEESQRQSVVSSAHRSSATSLRTSQDGSEED